MTSKEGQEVTLKSKDGVQYRHHSSFVKPFSEPVQKENNRTGTMAGQEVDPTESSSPQKLNTETKEVPQTPLRRSTRMLQRPARLSDFVLDIK